MIRTKNRGTNAALAASFSSFFFAPMLHAGTVLELSDRSSDETPASFLSASFHFSVSGDLLTLGVFNQTEAPFEFNLSEIFFNGASPVDDLNLLTAPPGWSFLLNQRADGFGRFDFALIGEHGTNAAIIEPDDSAVFTFDILGDGPFTDASFTTAMSSIPPGSTSVVAAAKFVNGPGDDSAFGALVPEPVTGILVWSGWMAVLARKRN